MIIQCLMMMFLFWEEKKRWRGVLYFLESRDFRYKKYLSILKEFMAV